MAEEQNELEGVPEPGEVVVGKYRVERILGVGGMGCVVAATHTTLDQPVAIKFLLNKAARNPKNIMRFQREAQAAAKIKSDHVAKVSDVGTLENGTPYMVMEFLDGEDLSERLQNGGPIPADEAVRYVLQACEALAEAHHAGIIHRDLKPANLFVATAADGSVRVKVLDFGISKIVDGGKEDLTKTSALMGSPLYMSPEQMMSAKAADGRADIWALGCILFELISGQPPFIGNTLPEICSRILTAPPTKISTLVRISPELEMVIERILSKKPEERYQNLAELANALYRFGGEQAARSAAIVCRVLDAPGLAPASSELPTSMSDGTGQHHAYARQSQPQPGYPQPGYPQPGYPQPGHPQPHAGYAASPGHAVSQAQSYPQPGSHSYPDGPSYPPVTHPQGTPMGAVVSHPQGAGTSQNGLAANVAGHTAPSMLAPGGIAAAGVITAPGQAPRGGALPMAMIQGAATGAPVAQTMSDDMPRKSRAPLFIGIGLLALTAVAAVVVIGLSGDPKTVAGSDDGKAPPAGVGDGNKTGATATGAPAPSGLAAEPEPETESSAKPSDSAPPPSTGKYVPRPSPHAPVEPVAPEPVSTPAPAPVAPKPDPKEMKTGDERF